jgi:hypothetical protein
VTRCGNRRLSTWILSAGFLAAGILGGCDLGNSGDAAQGHDPGQDLHVGAEPLLSLEGPGPGHPPFHQVVSALVLGDGRLVVADQAPRIMVLDSAGALLAMFGGSGDGPGEFRRLVWVKALSPDSLMVHDAVLGRASVFTHDGVHARTLTPGVRSSAGRPPRLVGLFDDGRILAAEGLLTAPPEGGAGIVRPDMILTLHDPEGAFLDSLGVVPGDERAVADGVLLGGMPFLRSTSIATEGRRFHVATGERDEVVSHDRDGARPRTVASGIEPEPLTPARIEAAGVPAPMVPLLPATAPAITALLADPAGRLWVGPYPAEAGRESAPWSVLDREGHPIAEAHMPPGFRPLDIGASVVIGVWSDSLGVEHVRVHPLRNGGARR